MTEDEAKTKWCPHARQSDDGMPTYNRADDGEVLSSTLCAGSACMAWRWHATTTRYIQYNDAEMKALLPEQAIPEGSDRFGQYYAVPSAEGYCGSFGKPWNQ